MNLDKVIKRARRLSRPYRIDDGQKFRLEDVDPGDTGHLKAEDKPRAKEALEMGVEALAALQDMLYAQDRWAVLLIFQAMDAAGKDGAIKHVMSGVNPQGCQVASFKAPSAEELDHDYLWRCQKHLPERGRIGIFNRSYYEEVLVVRVHPEFLGEAEAPARARRQGRLGASATRTSGPSSATWPATASLIRKFFLHVSRKEQKRRFLERLDDPEKNWKFSAGDVGRARPLEGLHGGLRGHDPGHRHQARPPGTSCPPTTSGSPASSWPRRSSTPWLARPALPEGRQGPAAPSWPRPARPSSRRSDSCNGNSPRCYF